MNPLMLLKFAPWLGLVIALGLWQWAEHGKERAIENAAVWEVNARNMEQNFKDQKAETEKVRGHYEQALEDKAALQSRYDRVSADYAEERRKIESYKERWSNVANRKPGLLARGINRATRRRVRHFQQITCRTHCDEDRIPPAAFRSSGQTEPD